VTRLAFFALLFINLAYFAWAHWVDAPRPAPVNQTIEHLPRLKLAEESPPAERSQPHTAQKTSLNTTPACLSMGPFSDVASSGQAAALLKAKGFEPRERTEQGKVSEGYWVYVAGLSQSEVDNALAALERNGIGDARVIPDNGEAGRRLSLGLYSERPRAEKRAEVVRQAGLTAGIAERKLTHTLYWLDTTLPPGSDAMSLQGLFAEGTSSRIAAQPCPVAASVTPPMNAGGAIAASQTAASAPATAGNPVGSVAGIPKLP
jgi:hypothetical protein